MSLVDSRVTGISRIGDAERRTDTDILAPEIRCLGRQHEAELYRLLLGLEASDRCSRFGLVVGDAYLANHAQHALAAADWIVGAFIDGHLRGVVEIYVAEPHGYAEAVFVVEQEWRRRGVGCALLRAAMQLAVDSKTHSLRVRFSRHNWAMRKLASKASGIFNMSLDEISVDVALGQFRLPIINLDLV
jgi:GNAT superfamily N-acetyltransferase